MHKTSPNQTPGISTRNNANLQKEAQPLCAEQVLNTHPASAADTTLSASSIRVEHQKSSRRLLIKIPLWQQGGTRQG